MKFDESSLDSVLGATTTVAARRSGHHDRPAGQAVRASTSRAGRRRDGHLERVASDSQVGYRVKETLAGVDTEGAGRTSSITGTMTIDGTTVTATDLTVDMTTFASDDSRRDSQFNGRIMEVSTYPTATFELTTPIDIGTIPTDGSSVQVQATGDLTIHGVTKPVTFDLTAKETGGRIGVVGSTVITFADYGIENPTNGFAETGDTGTLELQLVFDKAPYAEDQPPTDPSFGNASAAERVGDRCCVHAGAEAARTRHRPRGVAAAEGDQLVVGAELDEPGVVDHRDPVGAAHRRQAVGDDDHRAALHQPLERLLDHGLGAGVEVAVASSSTSTAGSTSAARASDTSCFSPADSREPRSRTSVSSPSGSAAKRSSTPIARERRVDLVVGRRRAGDADVVADRAAEQEALLRARRRCARAARRATPSRRSTPPKVTVPAVGSYSRAMQLGERRLAGAGRPDQREALAVRRSPATRR